MAHDCFHNFEKKGRESIFLTVFKVEPWFEGELFSWSWLMCTSSPCTKKAVFPQLLILRAHIYLNVVLYFWSNFWPNWRVPSKNRRVTKSPQFFCSQSGKFCSNRGKKPWPLIFCFCSINPCFQLCGYRSKKHCIDSFAPCSKPPPPTSPPPSYPTALRVQQPQVGWTDHFISICIHLEEVDRAKGSSRLICLRRMRRQKRRRSRQPSMAVRIFFSH